MAKSSEKGVRGSTSGRPIMVLFDFLGRRWALRILWELRSERLTFRELQSRCGNISPTILNRRLKELRELRIIDHDSSGYGHTTLGNELGEHLLDLSIWANRWAEDARTE